MTQPNPALWVNVCKSCGKSQNDDFAAHGIHAPMLHYGTDDYHLDDMPFEVEQLHRPQHHEAIDAAKAGTRGAELHAVIHAARERFVATEEAWIADEAAKFAKSGVANENPTHPMHAVAGA